MNRDTPHDNAHWSWSDGRPEDYTYFTPGTSLQHLFCYEEDDSLQSADTGFPVMDTSKNPCCACVIMQPDNRGRWMNVECEDEDSRTLQRSEEAR